MKKPSTKRLWISLSGIAKPATLLLIFHSLSFEVVVYETTITETVQEKRNYVTNIPFPLIGSTFWYGIIIFTLSDSIWALQISHSF